jgi:hypothetical protein
MLSKIPVLSGIYSIGRKDGIKPWMDISYFETVTFEDRGEVQKSISLSAENLDKKLFYYLGELIPPGGHLMVSYEDDQNIHIETLQSLQIGIPPAATPLGFLIFQAGLQYIKDW